MTALAGPPGLVRISRMTVFTMKLGRHPNRLAALCTRLRVFSFTAVSLCRAREIVAVDKPRSLANIRWLQVAAL